MAYYIRLRADVLLGRRATARPLGLGYRWRSWRYEQHLRRLKGRAWVGEEITEVKLPVSRRVEVTANARASA